MTQEDFSERAARFVRELTLWGLALVIVPAAAGIVGFDRITVGFLLVPSLGIVRLVGLYPLRNRWLQALLGVFLLPALVFDYRWLNDGSPDPQGVPVTWALIIVVGLLLFCARIALQAVRYWKGRPE